MKIIYWSVVNPVLILNVTIFIQFVWVYVLLIRRSGFIEVGPG